MELVTVFVHDINTIAHPDQPIGARWAVHLGTNPTDMDTCLNAGWGPTVTLAAVDGEMVGSAVAKGLRLAGFEVRYVVSHIDFDPQPVSGLLAAGG